MLGEVRLGQVRLCWVRLCQVGLGWVTLCWVRLCQVSFRQVRLGCVGLGYIRLVQVRLCQFRLGQVTLVSQFTTLQKVSCSGLYKKISLHFLSVQLVFQFQRDRMRFFCHCLPPPTHLIIVTKFPAAAQKAPNLTFIYYLLEALKQPIPKFAADLG